MRCDVGISNRCEQISRRAVRVALCGAEDGLGDARGRQDTVACRLGEHAEIHERIDGARL
jgi:hypothetical protein